MQLKMAPVQGDSVLEGKEEDLKFHSDSLLIDQLRSGVNGGGTMSRKRTLHDIRALSKSGQTDLWARTFDELIMIYLAGARGVNDDFVFPLDFAGVAGNAITAPDAEHKFAPGIATYDSTNVTTFPTAVTLGTTPLLDLRQVDRLVAVAGNMGGGSKGTPKIRKAKFGGAEAFVLLMSPNQAYWMRQASTTNSWLDMQKAVSASAGKDTEAFKGGLGMYNGVLMHEHQAVIGFSTYGAGAAPAARALFLGQQAGVIAFGSAGNGLRFGWHEETRDNGNQIVITTSTICGVKKTTFNGKDFGVIAIDSSDINA
jgi:N4-gp56 family major capsid protein